MRSCGKRWQNNIEAVYDTKVVKKVYISGDGAEWMQGREGVYQE